MLKQPAGLRKAFIFNQHDCCNLDLPINLSQILTHYFSSRYIIHIPNRNTKFTGAQMISFALGCRGLHVFITMKKWQRSESDTTLSKHENVLKTQQSACYCYWLQHRKHKLKIIQE
jgi:hypothetical protein